MDNLVSTMIDAKNWPETMESLEEYLRGNIVVRGVLLSYVMRSKNSVAPNLDKPKTSFSSAEYEMVARTLIIEGILRTVTFKIYMTKVWGLISAITRDLECWTYFKSDQRTRDRRKAYPDLRDHLLGPDNVDNMESETKRLLTATH